MNSSNNNGGEQPLEDKELCTLVETLPTRCENVESWLKSCEYATVYATTVTLLPTHRPETNAVMLRNRRIGVGLIDVSGWKHLVGANKVIKYMRQGYKRIRKTNKWLSDEAGTPEAIRVTTCKPGGTTPKIAGRTSGFGHPNFIYTLRRVRVAKNSPMVKILSDAGIPNEPDINDPNGTLVFEWPIKQGPAKPASEVSLWQQAMNLVTMQREWSDNAVSNTLTFRPKWKLKATDAKQDAFSETRYHANGIIYDIGERFIIKDSCIYEYNPAHEEDDIEAVLSDIAPLTKSVSMLPQTEEGVYPQMPESGITEDEYNRRKEQISEIDWSSLSQVEAEPDRYCQGEVCENNFNLR